MSELKYPHTILVVDDELGPRQAIRMILQNKYNVLTCDNIQEAMDIVCLGVVDVVLLDIRMPGVDGVELLKQMKAAGPDIEVALITGYPSTESVIKAMQNGAYDYVIKPFDKDKIEEVVVRGILNKTKRQSERKLTAGLLSGVFKQEADVNKPAAPSPKSRDYASIISNQEAADRLYQDALSTVEVLLDKIRKHQDLAAFLNKIEAVLEEIIRQFSRGNALLNNLYAERVDNQYFLPFHIINLTILSLFLGIKIKLEPLQLKHLGFTALFSDVGMDNFKDVIIQPRKLDDIEYNSVKAHVSNSLEVVRKIAAVNIHKQILDGILTHHERCDGTGYPRGVKSAGIHSFAKIIGLADTYDALTHQRPYRARMQAHQTIKLLSSSLKSEFDCVIIKALINNMSVYPIGSLVQLDTKEQARVIDVNPDSPMRPVVILVKDAFGKAINERIIVDLSAPGSPSVVDPA